MIDAVRWYDDLVEAQVGILRRITQGLEDAELDWRPHPQANPVRWILGHHLWYEAWVPDAIEGTGRYRTDRAPASLSVASIDAFWTDFEAAADRRRAVYAALGEPDLERRVDYLGTGSYSVARLVRTHAAHFTGHTWQVRYVRGTYARATGRDPKDVGLF